MNTEYIVLIVIVVLIIAMVGYIFFIGRKPKSEVNEPNVKLEDRPRRTPPMNPEK